MTALENWQAQVRLCRSERPESEEQAWQRLAQWYDDWMRYNDYVTRTLPRLLACVNVESRALEIGPGSGAFTLPLARVVKQLVALEPSSNMRCILQHKLDEAGITNVQIIPQRVEDGLAELGEEFDLALASHSLYNVEPIDRVVRDLLDRSRHVVILMGTGVELEWHRALQLSFRGKPRVLPGSFREFYPMLMEMGIYADVEILPTSANYVYDSENAMLDWWQHHFGLDASRRDELHTALARITERRGDQIGIYGINRTALMWIDHERNLFERT